MSDIAIRVENLGKSYRIAHNRTQGRYKTLQEDVIGLLKRPFQRGVSTPTTEEFWALKDISFEVKQGEVLGIIGRNGAGKSTLLKILSRITRPTTGYAEMHGRIGSLLEVGTGFHPELTGRENIFLNGAVLGMSRRDIQKRFDEIVAFAEVEKFLDTPVKRYSSGMYMRLAFGVAAHLEPEILVVDEVLAVGDAEFQKKSLGKMSEVAQSGRTVLFVSHNMGAVTSLCTRAILLKNGKIVIEGLSNIVVSEYTNRSDNRLNHINFPDRIGDATFISISTSGVGEEPKSIFEVTEPIILSIRFVLTKHIAGLQLGVMVLNHRMERVFYSTNLHCKHPIDLDNMAGVCEVNIVIPALFLTPGRHYVTVTLHRPNIVLYDTYEEAISFDVEETGSGLEEFSGVDIGKVLAKLDWSLVQERQMDFNASFDND